MNLLRRLGLLVCCSVGFISSSAKAQDQSLFAANFSLKSPAETGINFRHTDGGSGKRYIVETVLGSLALFDYDGDGFIDIYFVNGAPLPGTHMEPPPTHRLYRNLGNWKFADVTVQAGLAETSYGMGVVVGDLDQDGDPDLFVSNFGTDKYYVNNADGTFTQSASTAGFNAPPRFGAASSLFDMEGDGDLDLYCASYVEFKLSDHRVRTIAGKQFHLGPNDFPPAVDYLYRNNGDGTFSDVSEWAGISAVKTPSMGVLSADFDDDGDMDVFVANDQKANLMWSNNGLGKFENVALLAGVALDRNGHADGSMGVEWADLNSDQRVDLIITTFQDEMPVYFEGVDQGLFSDSTNLARLDPAIGPHVKWGIGACDFDNDSDNDLFIAAGHFLDNIRFIDDRTDVRVANFMLANNGKGLFRNVTSISGDALKVVESSRGAAFDDLDNDGDLDLVVLNINTEATVGRNELPSDRNSLRLRLIGTRSNRDGVGSKVTVKGKASGQVQRIDVVAGRGYESYYGHELHFGLGKDSDAVVTIQWPSGLRELFECSGKTATLIEGYGQLAE